MKLMVHHIINMSDLCLRFLNDHAVADVDRVTYREPKDYGSLSSLRVVDLKRSISEDYFPSFLYNARSSLEKLDLSYNNFENLYLEIDQFSHLKYLNLYKFRSINVLPQLIQVLKADYCPDLRMRDDLHRECKWLFKISLIYSGSITVGTGPPGDHLWIGYTPLDSWINFVVVLIRGSTLWGAIVKGFTHQCYWPKYL
nr:hypothetical protein [Tanacetum cinerariifolium]